MLLLPDGSDLTRPDLIDNWSQRRGTRVSGHWDDFRFLSPLQRYNDYALLVVHEVVHFTYPDPDSCDDYGRDLFTTLHRFVVPETARSLPRELAECPQFTQYRDSPPPPASWPVPVHSFTKKLQTKFASRVFVERYLCDDEEFDMDARYPLNRTTRE